MFKYKKKKLNIYPIYCDNITEGPKFLLSTSYPKKSILKLVFWLTMMMMAAKPLLIVVQNY